MKTVRRTLALALLFAVSVAHAQPAQDAPAYESGYSSIMKLGRDLYAALDGEQKKRVSPQPISIETETGPSIRMLYFADEKEAIRGVWISAGFIDLMNQFAHAVAIDKVRPGYLGRYVELLGASPAASVVPPLPERNNPEFWKEALLNEQLSNFNSMVGVVVGIKLAHHYLGHYDKFKEQLTQEGEQAAINQLVSTAEWKQAFQAGVQNALRAGFLVEGAIPFFEALGQMKKKPAWAEYYLPRNADSKQIKEEMQKLQQRFMAGED